MAKLKKKRPRPARRDPRQLGLALPGLPGTVTVTALTLKGDLSYEEWERSCKLIGRVGRGVQWWVADLVMFGETKFGEKAYQGIEAMGYDPKTLSNVAWVAERIEPARRRAELSFGHHQVVAALDAKPDQDAWLEKAIKKGWTRAELRQAMKDAGAITGRGGPAEAQPDSSEAWTRIRKALDVVKGAKAKIADLPDNLSNASWLPKSEVTALLDELEGILFIEPAEPPAEPKKKPARRKKKK
jgi:hypothetical protein